MSKNLSALASGADPKDYRTKRLAWRVGDCISTDAGIAAKVSTRENAGVVFADCTNERIARDALFAREEWGRVAIELLRWLLAPWEVPPLCEACGCIPAICRCEESSQ